MLGAFFSGLAFMGCGRAQSGFSMDAAHVYQARGDYQGLYRYGEAWVRAEPKSNFAWYILGKGQLELGRDADAARSLERSIELGPDAALPYIDLAAVYSDLGQAQLPIKTIAEGEIKAAQNASAYHWFTFGNARLAFRQYTEAVADYHRALKMYPSGAEVWNNLGNAYQMLGNYTDALSAYDRASAFGNSLASRNAQTLRAAMSQRVAPARSGDLSCDAFCQKHFENLHRAFEGEAPLK